MRISNQEAKEKALRLSENFLTNQDHKGWSWICEDAQPDTISVNNKQGKTYIKWKIIVVWSLTDRTTASKNAIDGPGVLKVDIVTSEVQWA